MIKRYSNKIIIIILVVMNIGILTFILIQKNQLAILKMKFDLVIKKNQAIDNCLNQKALFEGKYIWVTGIITKKEFFLLRSKVILDTPKLFVWFNKIKCPKCYEYHKNKIQKNVGFNNIIVIFNGKQNILRYDFRGATFIKSYGKNSKFSELILLVNKRGRILNIDFPEYVQYNLSDKFYQKISNYLIQN